MRLPWNRESAALMKKASKDMKSLPEQSQNDDTFQMLIFNQRQMLNQIQNEKMMMQMSTTSLGKKPDSRRDDSVGLNFMSQPPSNWITNTSIGTQNFQDDILRVNKRGSIGLGVGNDSFVLPDDEEISMVDSEPCNSDCFSDDDVDFNEKKRKIDSEAVSRPRAKRRRSTLTFLNYLFAKQGDEDPAPGPEEHDVKKAPIREPHREQFQRENDDEDNDDDEEDEEDYGVYITEVSPDDHDETPKEMETTKFRDLHFEPREVKEKFLAFDSSMESSQKSQQAIHDWDRKMGLKKSHSKTMRLSSRSRKKLRQMMKRDVSYLNKLDC